MLVFDERRKTKNMLKNLEQSGSEKYKIDDHLSFQLTIGYHKTSYLNDTLTYVLLRFVGQATTVGRRGKRRISVSLRVFISKLHLHPTLFRH